MSAQGVHWKSKFSQYKRFDIITNVISDDITSSKIVDAGCGFGEYYIYLKENNKLPKRYIGFDCEEQMISISKKRINSADFYCKDILKDKLELADYYICSGSLNLLSQEDFYNFILKCWKYSTKALIFNFLKQDSFNHIKPQKVIDFCNTLSNKLEIYEYYLHNDMTICVRK